MNIINKNLLAITAASVLLFGCDKAKDEISPAQDATTAASGQRTTQVGEYSVTFNGVTYGGGNTTYSYIVTKTGADQGNGLSHWTIGLGSCVSFADLIGATIDGQPYTDLQSTEGNGTGCNIDPAANILKFDNLPDNLSSGSHTFAFTMPGTLGYEDVSVWAKYGNNCDMSTIEGPGCGTDEGCSMSMGYWFSKPNLVWNTTVTVGGHTYTQSEGKAIWNTSNSKGMKNAKMAFLQVSAIKLSGASVLPSASVWAQVAIAEAYLSSIPKLTPTTIPANSSANAAAGAAGGAIGNWIDTNHCTE